MCEIRTTILQNRSGAIQISWKQRSSHTAEEWHDAKYNDGKYNIIVEKFVDTNGKEIAKSVTTAGKAESAPKSIPGV